MNWKEFFKLSIYRQTETGRKKFFEAKLDIHDDFSFHQLLMKEFKGWNLSEMEKKKLSLEQRKILLAHKYFQTQQFQAICLKFQQKLAGVKHQDLHFSTQGGGIYLFLASMNHASLKDKKVICTTSELPLPILNDIPKNLQFIYHPASISYLSDFPSLWQESDLMTLFELKDYKSKVA